VEEIQNKNLDAVIRKDFINKLHKLLKVEINDLRLKAVLNKKEFL